MRGSRRYRETCPVRPPNRRGIEIPLVEQAVVLIADRDVVRLSSGRREVSDVVSDDHLSASPDRRRQNVPILRVVGHPRNQHPMSGDHGRREVLDHLSDPVINAGRGHAVLEQVAAKLVEDVLRPQRLKPSFLGDAQQRSHSNGLNSTHVSRRARNISVRRLRARRSAARPSRRRGGRRSRRPPIRAPSRRDPLHGPAVRAPDSQDVTQADATMPARLVERDVPRLQQSHESRSGDPQDVRGLTGGEHGVLRCAVIARPWESAPATSLSDLVELLGEFDAGPVGGDERRPAGRLQRDQQLDHPLQWLGRRTVRSGSAALMTPRYGSNERNERSRHPS